MLFTPIPVRRLNRRPNPLASANATNLLPLTPLQTQAVVGGCSHPQGCTTLDNGVEVASLRQPLVSDFMDRQRDVWLPRLLCR